VAIPSEPVLDPDAEDVALGGEARAGTDHSGRERIAWNVVTSWAGYLVYVVAGFVLPRFIDRSLGQSVLGVWDFAWTLVSYFGLAEIGTGTSVVRFVAKYRASGDVEGIRRTAASAMCVQAVVGTVVVLVTVIVTAWLPRIAGRQLGSHTALAIPVVGFLGLSVALQMGLDVFHGVMIGCHRWDLHNAINSGFHALTVTTMIVAVVLGGGLPTLAGIHLGSVVVAELTRRHIAYRVCPELRIELKNARWSEVREMVVFSSKASMQSVARLVLLQGTSLAVAAHLGPAALALYARPSGLVRHLETLVNKFAHILIPAASSLQASGTPSDLRNLVLQGTRFAVAFTLPATLVLMVLGSQLLHLWMGPNYALGTVLAIMAGGLLLPVCQRPVTTVLMGMNLHGFVAGVHVVAAVAGAGVATLGLGRLGWGLEGTALSVAVALTAGSGIVVPAYACKRLGLPYLEYLREGFLTPVLCALPFAAVLATGPLLFPYRPGLAVVFGLTAGTAVLLPLYWLFLVPPELRDKVRGMPRRALARL
jgi:O-antigen/teichoic acid export membrane protein